MTNLSGTNLNRSEATGPKGEGKESPNSFFPYSDYKSSGIDWLGPIPIKWRQAPLWTLFTREKRTGHASEELLSVYRDYGVIPKSSRGDNFNKASDDLSTYQLVEPGDLAINKMKAWQGSVAISQNRGIVSPAYHIYKATHSESSRYLHHLFRSKEYVSGYLANSKGIRVNQWDLEPQQHSRMAVLLPSIFEQTQIARFLDHETAKIDALIREQERLIALLQEKRQAVISHAVTKGLDPNVPMKDSGVEWLGEVPAHWKLLRLKNVIIDVIDTEHKTVHFVEDGEYPVVRTSNVRNGKLLLSNIRYTDYAGFHGWTKRGVPQPGDIIFTREAPAGEACIVPQDISVCLGQRTVLLKLDKGRINELFCLFSIYSGVASRFIENLSQGSTVSHLNMADIPNMPILLPPLSEQLMIAEYVQGKAYEYDRLIESANTNNSLLSERRTALISAAVTGKIDIRNWQTPVNESAYDESVRQAGMEATA